MIPALPALLGKRLAAEALGEGIGEVVATFVPLFTILGTVRRNPEPTALTVPAAMRAGLLVHLLHLVHQYGDHRRPLNHRFVLWHRPGKHRDFRGGAMPGCGARGNRREHAVARRFKAVALS